MKIDIQVPKNPEEVSVKFVKIEPDTRMVVDDPELQELLDWCRDQYERVHGKPKSNGALWAHQLSVEEQRNLPKKELRKRIAPWQIALWAMFVDEAINEDRIEDLPDFIAKVVKQMHATGKPSSPPVGRPIDLYPA